MIKYTTTHEHGIYNVEQVKWSSEEHYNCTDIYSSFETALEFVQDINEIVQQLVNNKR